MKENNKFLLGFFIALAGLIIAFLGFVIYVDPGAVFHQESFIEKTMADALLANQKNIIIPTWSFNERKFKQLFLAGSQVDEKIVVMGASTSRQIGMKTCSQNVVNLAVDYAKPEDYVAFLNQMVKKAQHPEAIFLAADPYMFDEGGASKSRRWLALRADIDEGQKRIFDNKAPFEYQFTLGDLGSFLNRRYFNQSVDFYKTQKRAALQGYMADVDDKPFEGEHKILIDGSQVYDRSYEAGNVTQRKNLLKPFNGLNYSAEKIQQFIEIALYAKRNLTSDVQIVLIPFPPLIYAQADLKAVQNLKDLESAIRVMAATNHVSVLGSYDPMQTQCNDSQFMDEIHPNGACIHSVLSRYPACKVGL